MPPDWVGDLTGERLVAVHVAFSDAAPGPHRSTGLQASERWEDWFVGETLSASQVAGSTATVWTDFRIHEDGFSRILIRDGGLDHRRAGRLVQRLLEVEAYRTAALLALPVAREIGPQLSSIEGRLTEITAAMCDIHGLADEHPLLDRLTRLSAETERLSAATSYRFSAARA